MLTTEEINNLLSTGNRVVLFSYNQKNLPEDEARVCAIQEGAYTIITHTHNNIDLVYKVYTKIDDERAELVAWGYVNNTHCNIRHPEYPHYWAHSLNEGFCYSFGCHCNNYKCRYITNDTAHNGHAIDRAIMNTLFSSPTLA